MSRLVAPFVQTNRHSYGYFKWAFDLADMHLIAPRFKFGLTQERFGEPCFQERGLSLNDRPSLSLPPPSQISHCIPTIMFRMVGPSPTLLRKVALGGSRSTLTSRWLPTILACLGQHSSKSPAFKEDTWIRPCVLHPRRKEGKAWNYPCSPMSHLKKKKKKEEKGRKMDGKGREIGVGVGRKGKKADSCHPEGLILSPHLT